MEEGHAEALGRPCAVGGHSHHRRARTRADGVPVGNVLGHRRHARRRRGSDTPQFRREARQCRRRPRGQWSRLRLRRCAEEGRRGDGARRVACRVTRVRAPRRRDDGLVGRGEALHAPPVRAVHDVDPAAGGRPQTPVHLRPHHAGGTTAVRERLHHLHAYRLDHAVRVGHHSRP